MMSIHRKSILQLIIFLLIASILIYWQYHSMDEKQILSIEKSIANAKWFYLIPALIISIVAYWLRALRWQMLFQPLNLRVSIKNSMLAISIGYLVNLLIPRAGEILRCTTLSRYANVPMDKTLGTVISERLFDMLTLIIVFIVVLLVEYQLLYEYGLELIRKIFYDDNGALATNKILLGLLVLFLGFVFIFFLIKRIKNTKIGKMIWSVFEGLKSILFIKNKLQFILITVLIWICYFTATYIVMQSMESTAHLSFSAAMAVTAFGSIAIIVTPGGIGAYPPITAGILSFYNITYPVGIALGWLSWFFQTIIVVVLGLAAIIILPLANQKKKNPLYDESKI